MDREAERLRELNERLIATAETVERHFAEAVEVKRQLDDLVAALGAAAGRAAAEAAAVQAALAAQEPRFTARRGTGPARQAEVLDVGIE